MNGILILTLILGMILPNITTNNMPHLLPDNTIQVNEPVNSKIYTVKEVLKTIENNPESLKGKDIKLKAFVLDEDGIFYMDGPGVKDNYMYYYFVDYNDEYTKEIISKYYNWDYKTQKRMRKDVPKIMTGNVLRLKNFKPTQYGVFEGHFYDEEESKKDDGYKKFIITKKVEEIKIDWPSTTRSEVIDSGMLIEHGRLIKPPYNIELKNFEITVNGVKYKPQSKFIGARTDQEMLEGYASLTKFLKRDGMKIYGDGWSLSRPNKFSINDINLISEILNSNREDEYKKSELGKVLEFTDMSDGIYKEFIKNWER